MCYRIMLARELTIVEIRTVLNKKEIKAWPNATFRNSVVEKLVSET